MWRQKIFPGDEDSDQSISDEEDFNVDLRDNCVSLGGPSEKEEVVQLQSRLDIMKGTHGETCGRIAGSLSPKKQISVFVEDEVETPEFPDEVGFIFSPRKASTCTSDEEAISANEKANALPEFSRTPFHKDGFHDFGSARLDGENTWSVVSKEAKALVHLNENALCSSSSQPTCKANKSGKGIQSKSKPKFSFRFQPRREGLFSPVSKNDNSIPCKVDELPERMETADCEKHSIAGLLGGFPGKKATQSEMVPDEVEDPHWCDDHSVAKHLDSLRDNSSLLRRNSKMNSRTRGKRMQVFSRRSISQLGDRTVDCEDLEPVGSGSSSDNEANYQNPKPAIPEVKRQTIVDRFQEALGTTSRDEAAFVAVPRSFGVGLFGKLQQVMQSEKETDLEFLKLQTKASPNNEPTCLNVKILSRYLDAKLIVCHVSPSKDTEEPQWPQSNQKRGNGGRERKIIFNPRVCCDVDIEVGSSIRIHPPWKEVQVGGNDESIILSTYFSQIST
ncbi:kinetochore protein [Citrus sinensis]|uniref:Kinetochore protein n=1 Tax=Citrus sinensis TaxID=2711 RepID=A0ACB8N897_CITSI|nr:kinetochore protein [Citrus sinensis]